VVLKTVKCKHELLTCDLYHKHMGYILSSTIFLQVSMHYIKICLKWKNVHVPLSCIVSRFYSFLLLLVTIYELQLAVRT